jgi:outer membrane protein assembly factor BamB
MKSPISVPNRKHTPSFRTVTLMLAIAPLWPMLTAANTPAHAQTSGPSPADWTQFHRDNMQRWNPYETVIGVNNVAGLGLKWKTPIVGSFASAVVNGVIYTGSHDGNVYALNASNGAKLWSYTTGGQVDASPAVANGVVYVGSEEENVYALNASTGAKLWSFATGNFFISSPTVANGVVYVGTDDGNLYALNATTGAKVWSYTTGGTVESPAVVNGIAYVSSYDGNLYALNASTGTKLWNYTAGGSVQSPAVANGVVYIVLTTVPTLLIKACMR